MGHIEWWGIRVQRSRQVQRRFALKGMNAFKPHVDRRHLAAFEEIVAGLALEDFEPLRQPIAVIRSFLAGEETAA
jgi:hypothetical protein